MPELYSPKNLSGEKKLDKIFFFNRGRLWNEKTLRFRNPKIKILAAAAAAAAATVTSGG